jgi:hypothetical protein
MTSLLPPPIKLCTAAEVALALRARSAQDAMLLGELRHALRHGALEQIRDAANRLATLFTSTHLLDLIEQVRIEALRDAIAEYDRVCGTSRRIHCMGRKHANLPPPEKSDGK